VEDRREWARIGAAQNTGLISSDYLDRRLEELGLSGFLEQFERTRLVWNLRRVPESIDYHFVTVLPRFVTAIRLFTALAISEEGD